MKRTYEPVPTVYWCMTLVILMFAVLLGVIFALLFPVASFIIALPFVWYAIAKGFER